MEQGTRGAWRRSVSVLALIVGGLAVSGCEPPSLLPTQTDTADCTFKSYEDLQAAYGRIVPGRTQAAELKGVGFDTAAPNVEVLSYLGVMERFMPRDSVKFKTLAPEVRTCVLAREHCSAYVFRPGSIEAHRTGDTMLDVLGFDRTTVSQGWSAEVVLLVLDDRVAYKVISGKPRIQETHEKVSPLGPLQDLGGAIVPTAERVR